MQVVLAHSDLRRAAVDKASAARAAELVTAFTADLYRRMAAAGAGGGAAGAGQGAGNLVCSPLSVATALGMTVQGAAGLTAEQMLRVLHADAGAGAAERLGAALGSLDQVLSSRAKLHERPGATPVRVELATANSLWGQQGVSWQRPFLDALAKNFGAGLRQVDYRRAAEPARVAINAWVSGQTKTRIPNLIPSGVLDALTRLVLVNALYLKAPWEVPFELRDTDQGSFKRLDGSTVRVPMMHGTMYTLGYQSGPDWAAVDLPYAGSELAMAVIVPAAGRFAAVERSLDPARLAGLLTGFRPGRVRVDLPRWRTRHAASLAQLLAALGMPAAFGDQADFSGMTRTERLSISAVLHEAFIAVDENGTEAAAATAVVMAGSALMSPPPRVTADRPFLYVIHDVATGTPLFIGRVTDPTAT